MAGEFAEVHLHFGPGFVGRDARDGPPVDAVEAHLHFGRSGAQSIDLVLIYPRRFLSWLRVVARVLRRSDHSDETVTRMTGRTITVRAAADTPRQIDGDSIGAGREVTCACLPGKLLIRVPR